MAAGVQQKKKKQEKIQNAKIDSYFKPAPKPSVSSKSTSCIKRPLENDENTHFNDENSKKPLAPSNSQPMKRQFGEIKGCLQTKSCQDVFRLPLRDTDPYSSLGVRNNNSKSSTTICQAKKKSAPGFAVLCDEDIEKGVEKAPTPPVRDSQESLADSQDQGNDSQTIINSQESLSNHELNTQCIQEGGGLNTQWTEATSSPIEVYRDDCDAQEAPQEIPLFVFQADDDDDNDNENDDDDEGENRKTENESIPFFDQESEDDDDDDGEGENSKTENELIPFFDQESEDEGDNSESTPFFDKESEDDDDNGAFADPELEFSVDGFGTNPEEEKSL